MTLKLITRALAVAAVAFVATAGAAFADPVVDFGFSLSGDGFEVGFGTPGYDDHYGEVCFYKHTGFGGSPKCYDAGDSRSSLNGNWNNNISSIELRGDVAVTVCRNSGWAGGCKTYHNDVASLPNAYNNKISSFESFN